MPDMKICHNHQEYQTPLLWTFAFSGAEYWCPFCGCTGGALGTGERVEATPELVERHDLYKKYSATYLNAVATLRCDRTEWPRGGGIWIPPSELPIEALEEFRAIRDAGWAKEVAAETLREILKF